MMAFWTKYEESGARRYLPTTDLEAVLKQDRISESDIRQFRSSPKVERLLKEVLQNRGFIQNASERVWIRPKTKTPSQLSVWAQSLLGKIEKSEFGLGITPKNTITELRAGEALHSGDFVTLAGNGVAPTGLHEQLVVKATGNGVAPIGITLGPAYKFGKVKIGLIPGSEVVKNELGEVTCIVSPKPTVSGDVVYVPPVAAPDHMLVEGILLKLKHCKPIHEEEIEKISDGADVQYVVAKLHALGWWLAYDENVWRPPKPIAEIIYQEFNAYYAQFGQPPNSLHIASNDWTKLCHETPGMLSIAAGSSAKTYQGMAVTLMPPGVKLFVSTIANNLSNVTSGGVSVKELSDAMKAASSAELVGEKAFESQKHDVAPKKDAPSKKITPPSQMKRKLAL